MFTVSYHPADGHIGTVVSNHATKELAEYALECHAVGAGTVVGAYHHLESTTGTKACAITDAGRSGLFGVFQVTET